MCHTLARGGGGIRKAERFEYRGFHNRRSVCGLEVRPLADGRTLVVCTELPENPGTSVTNFAEELATLVSRAFNLDPDRLVWVEHYPAGSIHGPRADWDLVSFTRVKDESGARFTSPEWRPMRPDDWRQVGMTPPSP